MYTQAMQMSFCQTNVMGLLLFHVQDGVAERRLGRVDHAVVWRGAWDVEGNH